MADDLHPYPLTRHTVHLCVDMQRLFSTEGPWPTPWMDRVLPVVTAIGYAYFCKLPALEKERAPAHTHGAFVQGSGGLPWGGASPSPAV